MYMDVRVWEWGGGVWWEGVGGWWEGLEGLVVSPGASEELMPSVCGGGDGGGDGGDVTCWMYGEVTSEHVRMVERVVAVLSSRTRMGLVEVVVLAQKMGVEVEVYVVPGEEEALSESALRIQRLVSDPTRRRRGGGELGHAIMQLAIMQVPQS